MLTAVKYLGSVGVGVTSPLFFRANDNNIYVVKLQTNRLGFKVLVNEFLGAELGKLWGLRFPDSCIIQIQDQLLQQDEQLAALGVTAGQHFASRYLKNTEYIRKHNISKATNIKEMAGIILFDHLFHNSDRTNNRRNLLLQRDGDWYKIYAIDNSHLFKSGRWTLNQLKHLTNHLQTYYQYSFGLLLKDLLSPQDFLPYLAKIKQTSDDQIDTIIQNLPQEWLLDPIERDTLADHIKKRLRSAEDIWQRLCTQIPVERGGQNWWHRRVIGSRSQCKKIHDSVIFSSKRKAREASSEGNK